MADAHKRRWLYGVGLILAGAIIAIAGPGTISSRGPELPPCHELRYVGCVLVGAGAGLLLSLVPPLRE